jgi:hypothetical protein
MSFTRDIPGGTATFYDEKEIPNRNRLILRAGALAAERVLAKIFASALRPPAEGVELTPAEQAERARYVPALSYAESLAFLEWRHSIVVASLKSWTLPEPLPTMETIADLEPDLLQRLEEIGDEIRVGQMLATDFQVSTDRDSPFNGSPTTNPPSSEAAPSTTPSSSNSDAPTTGGDSSPE